MRRIVFHIFLLFAVISATNGQNVIVTSSFDSTRIYIGDQIKFTVTIDKPSDMKVTIPIFKDTLIKKIEILSGPVIDSSIIKDGRMRIIEKYLITSFDSGFYQIPPVFAELKSAGGLKRFNSDYARLEVLRLKIAPVDTTAKIYDIIKPYRAPVTIGEIVPWALIIVVIVAVIWAAIRFYRNHKKVKTGVEQIVNPDPAHVIAFRELEELKVEELWQKGEIKNYYTRLTEILRLYLENRYRIYSLELTTAETLDALVKRGFKKDGSYNLLKTILIGADLVKFAKYNPGSSENESHYQKSWDFVQLTKEVEELPGELDNKGIAREGSL